MRTAEQSGKRDKEHITFDAVSDIKDVQLIGRSRIDGEKREFTFICRDGSAFMADFLPNDGRPGLYLTARGRHEVTFRRDVRCE